MVRTAIVSLLFLALCGCVENASQVAPPAKVTQVPSSPPAQVPAQEMTEGYELEIVPIGHEWNDDAKANLLRRAVQDWLEAHRDRKVVSIIPSVHEGDSNYVTHLVIVSYKGKTQ